jgi:hypothetical protein
VTVVTIIGLILLFDLCLLRTSSYPNEKEDGVKIAVLGTEMMGTATRAHLAGRGYEANLWGTKLDKDIIDALPRDEEHPTLNRSKKLEEHNHGGLCSSVRLSLH